MSRNGFFSCMAYDDVAWELSDWTEREWRTKVHQEDILIKIGMLIVKHRGGTPVCMTRVEHGSFNTCFRMSFKTGKPALIRFPRAGPVQWPEEKVRNEVQIMRYLAKHTNIPIPNIIYHGTTEESPDNIGPFIIMDYVEHKESIFEPLMIPATPARLEFLYGQMAGVLLELAACSFSRIGSPSEIDSDYGWQVTSRPLTFQMNQLAERGGFPHSRLPAGTIQSSSEYYQRLFQLHREHLLYQQNDAITSAQDCRRKYLVRQLLYKAASQGRLRSKDPSRGSGGDDDDENGPFRLFCDDFRPANVLLDDDGRVVGAIDWEFTYAAPAEFAFSAPWWLLLVRPERWTAGLDDWSMVYEHRLEIFLRALEAREREAERDGRLELVDLRLSSRMRASWRSGDFWITYAARKSFDVDLIFWGRLRHLLFAGLHEYQLFALLTDEERDAMEALVMLKMSQCGNSTTR